MAMARPMATAASTQRFLSPLAARDVGHVVTWGKHGKPKHLDLSNSSVIPIQKYVIMVRYVILAPISVGIRVKVD